MGNGMLLQQILITVKYIPKDGQWFAGLTDSGIKYVASSSPSRKAAYMRAMRNGSYGGVL